MKVEERGPPVNPTPRGHSSFSLRSLEDTFVQKNASCNSLKAGSTVSVNTLQTGGMSVPQSCSEETCGEGRGNDFQFPLMCLEAAADSAR